MNECDVVKTQGNGRGNGRRTRPAAVGLVSRRLEGLWAAPVVVLTAIIVVSPAHAQLPITAQSCTTGRELLTIPEVRSEAQKLKAVLMLSDENRSMWVRGPSTTPGRCLQQRLRYLQGWNVTDWNAADPSKPPSTGEPIPGPTLRARIGDLIQISFRNQVDTKNFPITLDRGDCDEATGTAKDSQGNTIKVNVYPRNNQMPNCVHGSSTSNIHFHGTHTTPSTTGDNVLLYIRPALRVKGKDENGIDYPPIQPTDEVVKRDFRTIFDSCETNGSPTQWKDLPGKDIPEKWRAEQERLLKLYDATAPYKGVSASLPEGLKLWPKNDAAIKGGKWPQYSVGAFPYCFRLPSKADAVPPVNMGQAPGTHWYHAHVHGSTALNVANGLAGAFIIEGPYDDGLRDFYGYKDPEKREPKLEEKVLVIQQLSTSLGLLSATRSGPPFLSVNGRREPVITMQPGQVQMWRIVNGAYRSFVQFRNFSLNSTSCSTETETPSEGETPCVDWRQTAQDGVQFDPNNYRSVGKRNAQFNMAGGNRVDLLVKAPSTEGSYKLQVWESTSESPTTKGGGTRVREVTLLTVNVKGTPIAPPMGFIDMASFPPFPDFLGNIPASTNTKNITYDTTPGFTTSAAYLRGPLAGPDPVLPRHTIDGELFHDEIKQKMVLNTVEEWTVVNKAVGIAHPFHIHINPFQVVEVFDPNSAEANDPGACYADPKDPTTWNPTTRKRDCTALPEPFVWWDVRAIPAASKREWDWKVPTQACDEILPATDPKTYKCPSNDEGAACRLNETAKEQQCTVPLPSPVKIPGYFKMRSRFVDFPGVFVQHCHILAHEDVGMMQFVEVYNPRVGPTKGTVGLRHY